MKKIISHFLPTVLLLFCLQTVYAHLSKEMWHHEQNKYGEKIYMHQNSTLLLVGEYLYYSVYCFNIETSDFSGLSKVGYVEMIDVEGNSIFKHKIVLETGRGQGDFFVPVSIASGNYKLLAYTQLMRNQGQSSFFQSDLVIINPYTNAQDNLRPSKKDAIPTTPSQKEKLTSLDKKSENGKIELEVVDGKVNYGRRQKVNLLINAKETALNKGSFSISVRKKDGVVTPKIPTSFSFLLNDETLKYEYPQQYSKYLPELRGEVVSGKAISKENGQILANLNLSVSAPGENYMFKVTKTDTDGSFYVVIDQPFDIGELIFQSFDNTNDLEIKLDETESLNYALIDFFNFKIDSSLEKVISERSVYNQIENNYFSFKPDSTKALTSKPPFYGKSGVSYILKEYTQFPKFNETILEVLNGVFIRRDSNGKKRIFVRFDIEDSSESEYPALVLVDGLPIMDHEKLLSFDSRKIKSVTVLRREYIYGSMLFPGLIDVITINDGYKELMRGIDENKFEFVKPLPVKQYFTQIYDGENENSRLPDFRTQLVWVPRINIKNGMTSLEFYTSDVKGEFEISLEGFISEGEPVSLKKRFIVD